MVAVRRSLGAVVPSVIVAAVVAAVVASVSYHRKVVSTIAGV